MRQAIEDALGPFKEANGEAMMLRKHHWMLHLATHLQSWGFLPNCWSLERKHKTIMKVANQTKKLTGFSLSLLEECLAHDLYNLQHSGHLEVGVQLLKRHAPSSKFHDFLCAAIFQQQIPKGQVWTATSAKLHNGASIHNKDFVLVSSTNACKWQVARMEHHFAAQGVVYSIVTFCTCIEYFYSSHSAQVHIQEQLQLIETSAILCPLIYADEERATRVFIPWAYRLSKD
jgi:hypothetical protein